MAAACVNIELWVIESIVHRITHKCWDKAKQIIRFSLFLSFCVPLRHSLYLSVFICLFLSLSQFLSLSLAVCLDHSHCICLSTSVFDSATVSVTFSVCLSVSPSLSLFPSIMCTRLSRKEANELPE